MYSDSDTFIILIDRIYRMRHLKHNRSATIFDSTKLINPQRSDLLPPLPETAWISRSPRLVTTKILVCVS